MQFVYLLIDTTLLIFCIQQPRALITFIVIAIIGLVVYSIQKKQEISKNSNTSSKTRLLEKENSAYIATKNNT